MGIFSVTRKANETLDTQPSAIIVRNILFMLK
jgi:hypothetical protein